MSSGKPMATTASLVDDDLTLVARVRGGDRQVFHELVSRYERPIYRVALGITRNAADAEEVTQETFLRAFEHLDQFRGESKFSTWLTQIAVNTSRMRLRKEHASLWESLDQPRPGQETNASRDVTEWRETPEEQYSREELGRLVNHALKGLHPSYREVLVLRDIQQLSTQETAKVLNLTVANVKTRLLRARLQLRDRLVPHFKKDRRP